MNVLSMKGLQNQRKEIMMRKLILEFGSGETNTNWAEVKRMLDDILLYRTGNKELIVKFQLFSNIPGLQPLDDELFFKAYGYCQDNDLECTASVFDIQALNQLLRFDPDYIKIACRPHLYNMINLIPKWVTIIASFSSIEEYIKVKQRFHEHKIIPLWCVAKYPAIARHYEDEFNTHLHESISDHTESLELHNKYQPKVYERHICYRHGNKPDNSAYASTIEEIKELL